MTTHTRYIVIYLWNGDPRRSQHVYHTHRKAVYELAYFRLRGWRAWIEEL